MTQIVLSDEAQAARLREWEGGAEGWELQPLRAPAHPPPAQEAARILHALRIVAVLEYIERMRW